MDSVVEVRKCMWCHKPYYLHDGRYRYCSDECAEKARLARCGGLERQRKQFLDDYWRRCTEACRNMMRQRRA